jgi:hypothetical protein
MLRLDTDLQNEINYRVSRLRAALEYHKSLHTDTFQHYWQGWRAAYEAERVRAISNCFHQ